MRINHADEAERIIDEGLAAAEAVTIESALEFAVQQGHMSIKEAGECLEAYQRAFGGELAIEEPQA